MGYYIHAKYMTYKLVCLKCETLGSFEGYVFFKYVDLTLERKRKMPFSTGYAKFTLKPVYPS